MPQQPYGMPSAPAPAVPGKGLGITSMVLGIVSLALFCVWYLAIPCAIVGVILGCMSYSKAKQAGAKCGMAAAGIACSCVALGILVIVVIAGGAFACTAVNTASELEDIVNDMEYYNYY